MNRLLDAYLEETGKKLIDIYKEKKICKNTNMFFDIYDEARKCQKKEFIRDFIKTYKKDIKEDPCFLNDVKGWVNDGLSTYCIQSYKQMNGNEKEKTLEYLADLILNEINEDKHSLIRDMDEQIYTIKYGKEISTILNAIKTYPVYCMLNKKMTYFITHEIEHKRKI